MYQRYLLKLIQEALTDTPVVFINGPRQAGKSTLAQELHNQRPKSRYETLDSPGVLSAAKEDPTGFVGRDPSLLIIDEIQRAPELYLPLKAEVDRQRQPARFLLTGSANVMLLPQISQALVGRMEILTLLPLATAEIAGVEMPLIDWLFEPTHSFRTLPETKTDILARLATGGYPEAQTREAHRRSAWFDNYIGTLLQRDVTDLSQIENITRLPSLLRLIATRSGGLLNAGDLGRTSDIPASTLRRYLQLLHAVFAIDYLPAWHNHRGKRLVKAPKLYLGDSGVLCHLLGVHESSLGDQRGKIVETFCIQEIRRLAQWNQKRVSLYHYRTSTGQEVDLLLEAPNQEIVGIEIKASETLHIDDFRGLRHVRDRLGDRFIRGVVFYMGDQVLSFGDRLLALPISHTLCLA